MKTEKIYCIYCKNELKEVNNLRQQYHLECFKELKEYNADDGVVVFGGRTIFQKSHCTHHDKYRHPQPYLDADKTGLFIEHVLVIQRNAQQ